MEVRLTRNSWHTRLYRWAYGSEPRYWSLCPYFWTIVICLIASPVILIFKAVGIIRHEPRHHKPAKPQPKLTATQLKKEAKLAELRDRRNLRLAKFLLTLLAGLFVFAMVSGFQEKGWFFLIELVAFVIFLPIVTLMIIGISWISSKAENSDSWNAIVGMVRAGWDKVCPAIDWQEEPRGSSKQ